MTCLPRKTRCSPGFRRRPGATTCRASASARRKDDCCNGWRSYSGTWLGRALPPDGVLHTLEVSSLHARVARASFARAALGDRVRLHEGPALQSLQKLSPQGPFDLVFIDADKEGYPDYLA